MTKNFSIKSFALLSNNLFYKIKANKGRFVYILESFCGKSRYMNFTSKTIYKTAIKKGKQKNKILN